MAKEAPAPVSLHCVGCERLKALNDTLHYVMGSTSVYRCLCVKFVCIKFRDSLPENCSIMALKVTESFKMLLPQFLFSAFISIKAIATEPRRTSEMMRKRK